MKKAFRISFAENVDYSTMQRAANVLLGQEKRGSIELPRNGDEGFLLACRAKGPSGNADFVLVVSEKDLLDDASWTVWRRRGIVVEEANKDMDMRDRVRKTGTETPKQKQIRLEEERRREAQGPSGSLRHSPFAGLPKMPD